MQYVLWLLKAAIFFTLFAFALNNQHLVTLYWFFGTYSQGPLVLVVLLAFSLGLAVGVAVMLPRWWRLRRADRQAAQSPEEQPPIGAAPVAAVAATALGVSTYSSSDLPAQLQAPAIHEL